VAPPGNQAANGENKPQPNDNFLNRDLGFNNMLTEIMGKNTSELLSKLDAAAMYGTKEKEKAGLFMQQTIYRKYGG
jgi:hypothetical protein